MNNELNATRKVGRPATGATSVHLRLEPDILAALDLWIKQRGSGMNRQAAVRFIVETTVGEAVMGADEYKKAVLRLAISAEQSFEPGGLETVKSDRRSDGSMSVTFNFRRLRDDGIGSTRIVRLS